jgi:uncharacterized protein YyaL (SSP411 family)
MRNLLVLAALTLFLISCNSSRKENIEKHTYTNELITETSPYLLQHAHNPVNWNAWNDGTLEKAKTENKLMIISIGYSACHWCHVMERESFEDSLVAATMNKHFISVKVDREERPDVDQIYINAVQLMTGSAGWPLNVIALPDGRPVWGGTYFPKEDWIEAISKMQDLYTKNPQKLIDFGAKLEEGIKGMDLVTLNTSSVDFENYNTAALIKIWSKDFDTIYGGYNRAPKFMMPNAHQFLLRHAFQNKQAEVLNHVKLTLKKMAYGGIYDHIGGGFSRYSTDIKWHIPHFEKMLYDNAQLVSLYSNAYLVTKNKLYKEIVYESLAFINREMTNEEGAFYSSLDADSYNKNNELEEGAYYVYTKNELIALLGKDFELFKEYYNINSSGIWEDEKYVLIRGSSDAEVSKRYSITDETLQQKKSDWKSLLLAHRNKRAKPRLDDKTLTSWNGLMLKGYIDAYKAFQEKKYLTAAIKNAKFIDKNQQQASGALYHNYKNGKSTINGYLEDYASVIDAYISLYEVTLDFQWIDKAKKLIDYTFTHFYDTENGMFYFTSTEDTALVTRNFEYRDNVIPSSNSIMAKNLFVLSHHYDDKRYADAARQMLKNVAADIEKYPSGFANWLDLLSNYQSKYFEIVIVGPNAESLSKEINNQYIPNKLIAGSLKEEDSPLLKLRYVENETIIYVCVNNSCKLPVSSSEKAILSIKNF